MPIYVLWLYHLGIHTKPLRSTQPGHLSMGRHNEFSTLQLSVACKLDKESEKTTQS